jgi:hypothetical protein
MKRLEKIESRLERRRASGRGISDRFGLPRRSS